MCSIGLKQTKYSIPIVKSHFTIGYNIKRMMCVVLDTLSSCYYSLFNIVRHKRLISCHDVGIGGAGFVFVGSALVDVYH